MSRRWGEISEVRQMYKCANDKGMVLDGQGASKKTKKARNWRKQLSPLNGSYLECCIAPVTLTAEAAAKRTWLRDWPCCLLCKGLSVVGSLLTRSITIHTPQWAKFKNIFLGAFTKRLKSSRLFLCPESTGTQRHIFQMAILLRIFLRIT